MAAAEYIGQPPIGSNTETEARKICVCETAQGIIDLDVQAQSEIEGDNPDLQPQRERLEASIVAARAAIRTCHPGRLPEELLVKAS